MTTIIVDVQKTDQKLKELLTQVASGKEVVFKHGGQLVARLIPAGKRLALADVLFKGGFPEEMTRPLREALGWGLTSLLALHTPTIRGQAERDPAADLPSPRLIQAELVERSHLPAELSQRLAQVRDLTAPLAEYSKSEDGEDNPPLSAQSGQSLLESVRDLLTLAQEQVVKESL